MAGPDELLELEAKLAQLRLAYHQSLPGKRRDIKAKWQAVKQNPADTVAWKTLQVSAHQLAGSAGSFGFVTLGDAAHSLDACIGSFLNETNLKPSEGVALSSTPVDQLDNLLREAAETALP